MDVLGETHREGVVRPKPGAGALLQQLRTPSIPIGGVIFDLCGVLYDDSAWQRWLLRLLNRVGLHTTAISFFRLWRREYLSQVACGSIDYWTALRQFLAACGLPRGQIDEVTAAAHARWHELQEDVYPLPNVPQTLAKLRQHKVRMGLVCSDWLDTNAIQRRLVRLHMAHYFDWRLAATELPGDVYTLLGKAVERLQLSAPRIAYVGRDAQCLRAADRLGLQPVAFNYDEDAIAAIYLDSFADLLSRLPLETALARAG